MQSSRRKRPRRSASLGRPPEHPTKAIVDLRAFRHNLDVVRDCVGKEVKILAVVKANAYGHGIREIASEAVRWGADYLGVARLQEAITLRKAGIRAPLLVFEVIVPGAERDAVRAGVDLTVCSTDGARRLNGAAAAMHRRVRVHVKVDTGMGRLGFPHPKAADGIAAVAALPRLELVGAYSHFATSEGPDLTYAREQILRFADVVEEVQSRGVRIPLKHMANSGAILSLPESHFSMVRPGIMLYGYLPRKGMPSPVPLKPVMSFVSRVSFLKEVTTGASVSYGRKYIARKATHIATVPVGYGDGYSRLLTGKANVLIRGKRYPVAGTVCMDHIMVDVGSDSAVREGDRVVLFGEDESEFLSAWDIAEAVETIPYEVTCLITPRVAREYVGA